MRIIKDVEFKEECPICGTKHKGDAVLIGTIGTQEGNIMEAKLFHSKCIDLLYDTELKLIFQRFD